ncbi:MAG: nucleoside-diphosphate kinase [Candidatus Dependentiae bacterium]|nr:nucleoside-diphosphate kinase [Candidatus Dependentiae bacterium]
MEQTFAIIKPHAVAENNSGKIIDMIEAAGFKIVRLDKITMTKAQADDLYVEHKERSFYNGMVATMTSSPVIVMKLQKDGAVLAWRDLMGATNPASAQAGTVRALFGKSLDENAAHGSDSLTSAARELKIFFGGCC